jgi:UDP-MurNAc hydroxylase
MRIRYIYSACVVVETADARILCDPWMTDGIYDGSWFRYPVMDDPIAVIGEVDAIYVSHIHPDHYDPVFLRRYLAVYPGVRLIIGTQTPPYLANKMRVDGFEPEVLRQVSIGGADLLIVPNAGDEQPIFEVDSALVVRADGQAVVNMNDNPFARDQIEAILDFCPGRRVDVALLPYAGAGPYPQTFAFADGAALHEAVARKRAQFFALFNKYMEALKPSVAIPFAGKYLLGGPLSALNPLRGVPDAVELLADNDGRVIVLADGGHATYDLSTGIASACRTSPYDPEDIVRHLTTLENSRYDYEIEIVPKNGRDLPIYPILAAAKARARDKVPISNAYWIFIRATGIHNHCFVFNSADDQPPIVRPGQYRDDKLTPRLEISIDERYLFGLLTRLYHWNNAEIGSHYRSVRTPETYNREIYQFLNMLQV